MDIKIRAGICSVLGLLTFIVFSQSFLVSLLTATTLYFFSDSFLSKNEVKKLALQIKAENPIAILKPQQVLTSEHFTNTELVETANEQTEPIKDLLENRSVCTETIAEIPKTYIDAPVGTEEILVKSEETNTKDYEIDEKSTSMTMKLEDKGTSFKIASSEAVSMTELGMSKIKTQFSNKFCTLETFYYEFRPKRVVKRSIFTQFSPTTSYAGTETIKILTKDIDSQTWMAQEDQEINTTQSLLQPLVETSEKVKSNSKELEKTTGIFSKEVLLSELSYERVTNKKGMITYIYRSHIECDFSLSHEAFPSKKPPYFISLVNFSNKQIGDENFELLKEHFQTNDRVVKIRLNEFKSVEMASYVDDPQFQILFLSIFAHNLSDVTIFILENEQLEEVFQNLLHLKWKIQQEFKPTFFLYCQNNIESVSQELTISIMKSLEVNSHILKQKFGFYDEKLNVYHLEASKQQSYNFIEEKINSFNNFKAPLSSSFKQDFDFHRSFKESLEGTLKYILVPEVECKTKAQSQEEDYGLCVFLKYKDVFEMPKSLLAKPIQEPNIIKISPILIKDSFVQVHFDMSETVSIMSIKPLSALFLSLSDVNFSEIFDKPKMLMNFIEVYPKDSDGNNIFKDGIFNKLSSWIIGSYFTDFIILLIDFAEIPDLHHSDLLLKYLSVMRDIERPLFILHKTSECISYEYSFKRISELLESAWASDRVLLHEEVTSNSIMNSAKLEQIQDQMNDNLFNADSHFDLGETCRNSFENAVEKIMLIQNTRKRELLIKADIEKTSESIVCKSELETTWKTAIRENFQQSILKNVIYISPGQYHIDKNISSTIYSTSISQILDHLIKVAIFSNLPAENLSHLYLSELSFCFAKNKDDTLLIFPSSRVITTSVSNHLNTSAFNTIFLHKFMERIADCLIISLFYDRNKLIETSDNFLGLKSMLKTRKNTKPILVFHQYWSEGQMSDYSTFFQKVIKDFDLLYCSWTGTSLSQEVRVLENMNEGVYAFDSTKQIIHRLVVPSSELVWKWYNGVLYKIMHSAATKNGIRPLGVVAQEAFRNTMVDCVSITDDDAQVEPEVQASNDLEKSWRALSCFSMNLSTEILPLWLIESKVGK